MRRTLFSGILFLISVSFALFSEPPVNQMTGQNNASAPLLQNSFLTHLPKSMPTVSNPIEAADAIIVKLDPSVDNVVSDKNPPRILWVWAEKHAEYINQLPDLQRCFDGVTLIYNSKTVSSTIKVSFKGETRSMRNPGSGYLDLPFSPAELATAGPYEKMTISLSGEFNFLYDRTILHYKYLPCSEQGGQGVCVPSCDFYSMETGVANFSRPFSSSMAYTVEGGNVLFFLASPVLREQWYRNNRFDNLAFSNRMFYKSAFLLNGLEISNASLYAFDLYNDDIGVWYIKSVNLANKSSGMAFAEKLVRVSPNQIQRTNDVFSYLYQANASYSGLGKNNATLALFDRFLNQYENSEEITSRMLSLNSDTMETGEPVMNQSVARPSLAYKEEKLTGIIINIGIIGVFLLIVLKRLF